MLSTPKADNNTTTSNFNSTEGLPGPQPVVSWLLLSKAGMLGCQGAILPEEDTWAAGSFTEDSDTEVEKLNYT